MKVVLKSTSLSKLWTAVGQIEERVCKRRRFRICLYLAMFQKTLKRNYGTLCSDSLIAHFS
jgi:hypothetical protein